MIPISDCQKILNLAVHEATGIQPHYAFFFSRHAPRQIGAVLASIEEGSEVERVRENIKGVLTPY